MPASAVLNIVNFRISDITTVQVFHVKSDETVGHLSNKFLKLLKLNSKQQ